MTKDGVYMSSQDIVEFELLNDYLSSKRDREELCSILGISERTVRRKAKRIAENGILGLSHGNRGKTPQNTLSKELTDQIIQIIKEKYCGFNIQHTKAFLKKYNNITISYSSLRRIMHKHRVVKHTQRRKKKARKCRDRMPRFGMLLQMDGSHHKWNGKEEWCLIGAIDDATSTIVHGEFFTSEDTINCMTVMQKIIEKYGIPEFIYTDRAGIYGGLKRQEFCQFKEACEELGIKIIFANSPEAKGRVERAWRTMQDRLVAELHFHNITHIPSANEYLQNVFIKEYW